MTLRSHHTMALFRWWAELLDSRFRIPGTTIRVGLDPLLSLLPGLGDLASPVFALALLAHGVAVGVPRVILVRMLVNAFIDALIGAVPLIGNVADIFWRSNTANLALLERYARPGRRPTRGDYAFVFGIAGVFGALAFVVMSIAIWAVVEIWRWL